MNESKFKRLIIAATITAVLLLVILVSILVYQIADLNRERAELEALKAKIVYLQELKETTEDSIELRQTEEWIIRKARELGYYFDGDTIYK